MPTISSPSQKTDIMDTLKKARSLIYIKAGIIAVAVIAAVCVAVWLWKGVSEAEITIGSDKTINVTPERIAEIRRLGQWEFLTVMDEVVVDTVRYRHIVSDDRLTCIYRGTVRLGINLDHASSDWVSNHGDTIEVRLPAPSVLDDRFIDEARTDVFYQSGKWGAYARESMYRRAAAQMKADALSPENIVAVRRAAADRFTSLFRSLGAAEVTVTFDE